MAAADQRDPSLRRRLHRGQRRAYPLKANRALRQVGGEHRGAEAALALRGEARDLLALGVRDLGGERVLAAVRQLAFRPLREPGRDCATY